MPIAQRNVINLLKLAGENAVISEVAEDFLRHERVRCDCMQVGLYNDSTSSHSYAKGGVSLAVSLRGRTGHMITWRRCA